MKEQIKNFIAKSPPGLTYRELARWLNKEGCRTPRGSTWTTNTLYTYMDNNDIDRPEPEQEMFPVESSDYLAFYQTILDCLVDDNAEGVARRLNQRGVTSPKGQRWTAKSISAFLQNRFPIPHQLTQAERAKRDMDRLSPVERKDYRTTRERVLEERIGVLDRIKKNADLSESKLAPYWQEERDAIIEELEIIRSDTPIEKPLAPEPAKAPTEEEIEADMKKGWDK